MSEKAVGNYRFGDPNFQRAMAIAKELDMSREQRYELAQMVPSVDPDFEGSWRELDAEDLHNLLTMLEGYVYLKYLLEVLGTSPEDAEEEEYSYDG